MSRCEDFRMNPASPSRTTGLLGRHAWPNRSGILLSYSPDGEVLESTPNSEILNGTAATVAAMAPRSAISFCPCTRRPRPELGRVGDCARRDGGSLWAALKTERGKWTLGELPV